MEVMFDEDSLTYSVVTNAVVWYCDMNTNGTYTYTPTAKLQRNWTALHLKQMMEF